MTFGNGQWVRARNETSAKAFMQERQMEAERREAAHIRVQEFWGAVGRGGRSLWRRMRGRR